MMSVHSFQSSRDPAGVDPSGMDIITGADPPPDESDPPILPPTSPPAGPPPPTPRRTHSGSYSGVRAPSPVMAFLVGNPPPPPSSPPPQRYHSTSPRRQHMPISPPGEPSANEGLSSIASSTHHQRQPRDEEWASFVEQKRREALAIYESPDLYVEPEVEHSERRYDTTPVAAPPVGNTQPLDLENQKQLPVAGLASPRSAATEPHSNKRHSKRSGNRCCSQESFDPSRSTSAKAGQLKKSYSGDEASSKKRRGIQFAGDVPESKTMERRGRGRGRGRSLERPRQDSLERGERRGFFRKLFRGGRKKSTEKFTDKAHKSDNSVGESTVTDPEILPPYANGEATASAKVSFGEVNGRLHSDSSSQRSKASSVSLQVETSPKERFNRIKLSPKNQSEVEVGLDTVASGLTNDMEPDRRDIFFAHDEVSTLTAPSAHSYGRQSVDPSPAEAMTDTSGLTSEPIGHYWNGGDKEGTPKVSTPFIDPFTEPFFQEPDGESPITANKVKNTKTASKLQVHVPITTDPFGETPRTKRSTTHTNEPSPRGWESPITELKDPMGSTYESNAKHRSSGASRTESSLPKIPPPVRALPHEFRREPSAFKDGSPYALDPPLKMHEEENATKSLVGLLTRQPSKGQDTERVAAEPPTPTLSAVQTEPQPPTPSVRPQHSAKTEASTLHVAPDFVSIVQKSHMVATTSKENVSNAKSPSDQTEKATPDKASSDKASPKKAKSVVPDSLNGSEFLDDLFQEKKSSKKPSIVRPISINITSSATKQDKDSPSGSQVIEIHRTQRLSVSPRSKVITPWSPERMAEASKGPAPLPVDPTMSPNATKSLSRVLQRRIQQNSNDEEEKKEADHVHSYSIVEEPLPKSMLATSTAALSTAACMNAKTVAYLHTLNGEPSPRHAWRRADLSDDEYSPVKSEQQRKAISNIKAAMAKKRGVVVYRTDEAAFDNFISSAPPKQAGGAYSTAETKFKSSEGDAVTATSTRIQTRNKYGALSPRSRKMARKNFRRPVYYFKCNRDVRVTGAPLSFGLDLQRQKRLEDILSGRVIPFRPAKKKKRKPVSSSFQPLSEEDIKDPIQRAGRRLLSKAAIPIQCEARKYLARREAASRMSAVIVLQTYFRRWKCEAFLRAYQYTCTKIQAAFRSWMVRDELAYKHYHATQIQKVVRGYIAAAYVYDAIYWVSRLQATMRGKLARVQFANLKLRRQQCALLVQAWYRGCTARRDASKRTMAIRSIQAMYRSYSARFAYQVTIVDIIITQGVVRQFLARKVLQQKQLDRMSRAACKIQATWRGFQGYTDYIFALVDILVLQRSMRKWLAKKKVEAMRRHRAAIKIQSQWRRQTALIGMLYDLVHIIIAQSVARRFLVKLKLPKKRKERARRLRQQQKLDDAATKIQTAWRGFWGYSHYIIMQYEIIRLQAIVRGRAARILFSLKLGCCIMIQSAARRFLANKKMYRLRVARTVTAATVEGMRMRLACRRIQFWWRVVLECNKEKAAALVIERFFLMVKAEVDKEINRQRQIQTKPSMRGRRSRDQKSEADEKLLERVWLNTVDEDHVDIFACTSQEGVPAKHTRSRSAPRLHPNPSYISEPSREGTPQGVKHHPSSPTINLVMRHEYDPARRRELELRARQEEALKTSRHLQKSKPPPDVTLARSDERTEVSAITSPTIFKMMKRSKQSKRKDSEDDLSLEESLLGEDIESVQSGRLHSAPSKSSKAHHFFSDDPETAQKQLRKPPAARRHHSTGSTAGSDISQTGSEASEFNSHKLSRKNTATTMSRTTATHIETVDSSVASHVSECTTEVDMRKHLNQNRKDGSDKYFVSAVSKGRQLIEKNRKGGASGSPRHGRINITNAYNDFPILSQDSRDNVEVEYVGEQFGMI